MRIQAIKTPVIGIGQDLFEVFRSSFAGELPERSIVCVTSKVVSLEQRRVVDLSKMDVGPEARSMRKLKYSKDIERYPGLAELILRSQTVCMKDSMSTSRSRTAYSWLTQA